MIHEGRAHFQLLRDRQQSGLDGGVAGSGKAGNDEFRLLISCFCLARHPGVPGLSPQCAASLIDLGGQAGAVAKPARAGEPEGMMRR